MPHVCVRVCVGEDGVQALTPPRQSQDARASRARVRRQTTGNTAQVAATDGTPIAVHMVPVRARFALTLTAAPRVGGGAHRALPIRRRPGRACAQQSNLGAPTVYEIIGRVQTDGSVTEMISTVLGDNFGMAADRPLAPCSRAGLTAPTSRCGDGAAELEQTWRFTTTSSRSSRKRRPCLREAHADADRTSFFM